MAASTGSNTFYARPVYLSNGGNDSQRNFRSHAGLSNELPKSTKNVTIAAKPKVISFRKYSDIEDTSPPPRPPPPRPSRALKQKETESSSPPYKYREQNSPAYKHRDQIPPHYNQTTPEPKPLTRLNVTSHDQLWQKDFENDTFVPSGPAGPSDILSPPMKYITPQSTEEMWKNYDPLDGIDSMSDHSDASVDTMIMMTTEEEMKNKEKINHSLKEYTSVKSKTEDQNSHTNKLKVNIQSKKNLHIHFADTNGLVNAWTPGMPNGLSHAEDQHLSKVSPLHIKTDNENNGSSPESITNKINSNQGSPNDDSPDDGYGTNSSSGTVSSPFSSSFGSNSTDVENSCNGNSKKVILPNGAIKPNSVRESWAVKRKQRMIDAQDNSVQEQLRQLTIIEEEGSAGLSQKSRIPHQYADAFRQEKSGYGVNMVGRGREKLEDKKDPKSVLKSGNLHFTHSGSSAIDSNDDSQAKIPFVNVSQTDLELRNRQLYVINSESDTRPTTQSRVDQRNQNPLSATTSETNSMPARVPPLLPPDYTYATVRARNHGVDRNGDRVFMSGRTMETSDSTTAEDDSDFTSLPDSLNSAGPFTLKGGSENRYRTASGSGKIYVSPNGDEGFYSLNRSSRSTSMSSFQPINEVTENITNVEPQEAPCSPLEALSGELLEKWSDMDRNYRNYYGFGDQIEKYSRTDSKINYFQEKKINNMYGQDNYYRPSNYGPEPSQGHDISGHDLANQGTLSRDSSRDRHAGPSGEPDSSSRTSTMRSAKTSKERSGSSKSGKEPGSSKSKLFQILPNMFRPSSKKQNSDGKSNKKKQKPGQGQVLVESMSVVEKHRSLDLEQDGEIYVNMGDLPQYSLANIVLEEKKKKGQYVSLENLQKRPVFASSKDIQKLFSQHDQSFDSINHPGGQRHSFHAMPLSYRHVNVDLSSGDDMRPRAQSTSAAIRSVQVRNSVETRMSVITRKNAAVMHEAQQMTSASSNGNISLHSNTRDSVKGSRTRLDSGSSGGDSKLSTLV